MAADSEKHIFSKFLKDFGLQINEVGLHSSIPERYFHSLVSDSMPIIHYPLSSFLPFIRPSDDVAALFSHVIYLRRRLRPLSRPAHPHAKKAVSIAAEGRPTKPCPLLLLQPFDSTDHQRFARARVRTSEAGNTGSDGGVERHNGRL